METLSGGDVTKWDQIKALDYEVVIMKLRINRDSREFNKRLQEIKTKKAHGK